MLLAPRRLMIVRGAAAVGRPAGRVDVVAGALEQHDRQADHLGVSQHVAAEPEGDAIAAYSHLASSSSLSCSRAKILTRGKERRVLLGRNLTCLVEGALLGDPDQQHGIEALVLLRACRNAQAALVQAFDPGQRVGGCRLAVASRRKPSVATWHRQPRKPM